MLFLRNYKLKFIRNMINLQNAVISNKKFFNKISFKKTMMYENLYNDVLNQRYPFTVPTKLSNNILNTFKSKLSIKKYNQNNFTINLLSNAELFQLITNIDLSYNKLLIENYCISRINCFTVDEIYYCADLFYKYGLNLKKYMTAIIPIFNTNSKKFVRNKNDLLFLSFYLSVAKSSSTDAYIMELIETMFQNSLKIFSLNEISLICHGFFTTNSRFKNFSTLEQLSNQVITLINNEPTKLQFVHITNILKVFRHANFSKVQFYIDLGNKIKNILKITSDITLTEMATISFTYASLKIYHKSLANQLSHTFCKNVEKIKDQPNFYKYVRLKDLSRFLSFLVMFSLPSPKLITDSIINLLTKDLSQIYSFPEITIESLISLACLQIYPQNILSLVMCEKFLKFKSAQPLEQHFQMLALNSGINIEAESYTGSRLNTSYLSNLSDNVFGNLQYELLTRQGLLAMIDTLHLLLKNWKLFDCTFLLKHSRIADIVLNVDIYGKPIEIESSNVRFNIVYQEAKKIKCGINFEGNSIISQLTEDFYMKENYPNSPNKFTLIHLKPNLPVKKIIKKLCIKIMGYNQYALNDNILLGLHKMELRLLQTLGYEVFVIDPNMARQLEISTEEERIKTVSMFFSRNNILNLPT